MRLPDTLRRRLRGPVARWRGFRGNLDGEIGGALVGWALLARGGPARVGLYVRGALLAQTSAHVYRGDLAAQALLEDLNRVAAPRVVELETAPLVRVMAGS